MAQLLQSHRYVFQQLIRGIAEMKNIKTINTKHRFLILMFITNVIFASQGYAHDLGSNKRPIAFGADQTIVDVDKLVYEPLEVEGLPKGAEIAHIRGDLGKAGSESILRIPPGYHVPSHTHTSEELYMWISGAFTLISDKGEEKLFRGPAYISFPGNAPPHTLICGNKEPCVFYLAYTRPFDIIYEK